MKILIYVLLLFLSVSAKQAFANSTQWVCNPWTFSDGSRSDSFVLKWDKRSITTNYKTYNLVYSNDSGFFIFVWDEAGIYPETAFVNSGKEKLHFFITDFPNPEPPTSEYDYFHFSAYTSCKKF